MRIHFTDETQTQLRRMMKQEEADMLRLIYDTEDCGCGVHGVLSIRMESEEMITDKRVESSFVPVVVNEEQALFFDEEMKVEMYKGAFRLKGANGVLNPVISPKQLKQRGEYA